MSVSNIISNPFPLGLIVPGASFATVSVSILANHVDLATGLYSQVDSIYIHALSGNLTDSIYFMNNALAPDTTAYLNILDVISSGASTSISSGAMNTLQLSQFFVGASSATAGAIVTVKFR